MQHKVIARNKHVWAPHAFTDIIKLIAIDCVQCNISFRSNKINVKKPQSNKFTKIYI